MKTARAQWVNNNCDVTSGLAFIQYLNVLCNSDIFGQNQVKLGALIKQDEKTTKI